MLIFSIISYICFSFSVFSSFLLFYLDFCPRTSNSKTFYSRSERRKTEKRRLMNVIICSHHINLIIISKIYKLQLLKVRIESYHNSRHSIITYFQYTYKPIINAIALKLNTSHSTNFILTTKNVPRSPRSLPHSLPN